MYVPPHARETRLEVLHAAIEEIAFGALATVSDDAPVLTHLPMMLRPEGPLGTLVGHVARANPQWKTAGSHAVAAFVGSSFYVSPGWYARRQLDGNVVPTYDYIAVEARGTIAFFDDPVRLRALVDALTEKHEAGRAEPWSSAEAPADFLALEMRGFVGFELAITTLTGAWKLNRNMDAADRNGVADAIATSGDPSLRTLAGRVRAGS